MFLHRPGSLSLVILNECAAVRLRGCTDRDPVMAGVRECKLNRMPFAMALVAQAGAMVEPMGQWSRCCQRAMPMNFLA